MLSFRLMLARNSSSRITSSATKPMLSFGSRAITINAYEVKDEKGTNQAVVMSSQSDIKQTETIEDYDRRVNKELTAAVKSLLPCTELLGFKLRPCTLNPSAWKEGKIDPFTAGYIECSYYTFTSGTLSTIDITSISKKSVPTSDTPYPIPEQIQKDLIIAQSRDNSLRQMGSEEFLVFINPSITNVTKRLMAERSLQFESLHPLWQQENSLSGQAVYEIVTGKLAETRISPQTALMCSISSVISNETVKEVLKRTLELIGAAKPAHQLGHELLEKKSNVSASSSFKQKDNDATTNL